MRLTELSDYVIPEQELPRIFWMSPLGKVVIYTQAVPFLALTVSCCLLSTRPWSSFSLEIRRMG